MKQAYLENMYISELSCMSASGLSPKPLTIGPLQLLDLLRSQALEGSFTAL
jgi:hypothetical protein